MDGSSFGFDESIRALQVKLTELETEHRTLDEKIIELHAKSADMISLQRFKRMKLRLKDEISQLRGLIHPNIIA